MRTPTRIAVLLSLALPACSSDFEPPSLLNDLRVLALVADPPELGPTDEVTLRPVVYFPPGDALAGQDWSFCPFDLGAQGGYACIAEACELPLATAPDGSSAARPLELALECARRLGEQGPPPPGLPAELPEQVEVRLRYEVRSALGDSRQAVLRLPVWTRAAPAAPNRNPRLAGVELGGRPAEVGALADPLTEGAELEVTVRVDPDSLDPYLDEAGVERVEQPLVSFYATAGRFAYDRDVGSEVRVTYRAEPLLEGETEAALWFGLRDLRGGQAVSGPYRLPLVRAPGQP
jgi:hypothetical protein